MGAVPAKCLQCKADLRYDLAHLRYRCPACDAGEARRASAAGAEGAAREARETREAIGPPADAWRERGEALGRGAARLLRLVERWLGK